MAPTRAGTRAEVSQNGHPQSPAALILHRAGRSNGCTGGFPDCSHPLGRAGPSSHSGSTSAVPGTAPTPVSAVLGSPQAQPARPRSHRISQSPAPHTARVTRVQPVPAPVRGWLLLQWAPAFSIHVLMNHLTKMQPDSGWICSEQCGFVEGTTALCFPRQDPAAQPSCSTPARSQGSGGSPEESLGWGWRKPPGAQEPVVRPPQMPMPTLALSPTTPDANMGSHQPGLEPRPSVK